jgi:hypothetical protein
LKNEDPSELAFPFQAFPMAAIKLRVLPVLCME